MTPVKPIDPRTRDKLIVALSMDEIIASLNLAMRVRRITLTLDYTHKDHHPRLYISMPGIERELLMIVDPRKRVCYTMKPRSPDLLAGIQDIITRLQKLEARIVLAAEKAPNSKAVCKLQVQVSGSRLIVLTLADVTAGKVTHETSFQTPDGRTP